VERVVPELTPQRRLVQRFGRGVLGEDRTGIENLEAQRRGGRLARELLQFVEDPGRRVAPAALQRGVGEVADAHEPICLRERTTPVLTEFANPGRKDRAAQLFGRAHEISAIAQIVRSVPSGERPSSSAAERVPLLLLVEDAQWLDRPTSDALAFVSRRVSLEPIAIVFAVHDGVATTLDTAALPSPPNRASISACMNRWSSRLSSRPWEPGCAPWA
jgi:hypothetical protein